jgi:hypothetical protein
MYSKLLKFIDDSQYLQVDRLFGLLPNNGLFFYLERELWELMIPQLCSKLELSCWGEWVSMKAHWRFMSIVYMIISRLMSVFNQFYRPRNIFLMILADIASAFIIPTQSIAGYFFLYCGFICTPTRQIYFDQH